MVKVKSKIAVDTNLNPCKDGFEIVPKLVCKEKCNPPRKRDPTTNQCATPATVSRNLKKNKKTQPSRVISKKTTKKTTKKASKKTKTKKCKPKKK